MKTKYIVVICLVCIIAGFLAGRKTIATENEVKYVQDDPVTGSVPKDQIKPEREEIPDSPALPLKPDTIRIDSIVYIALKVDTAAIIADYITKREYMPILFDSPKLGKLSLSATVQYNKIADLNYEFIPITKEIIKYKTKVWEPFSGVSYNTLNEFTISGGTFYHNLGIELQYISNLNNKSGYGLGLKYKF